MSKKEFRPRLTPEEYEVILEHRRIKKHFNKKVIATLINNGDSKTKEKYSLSDEELEDIKKEEDFEKKKQPRILLFDIETLPIHARLWGLYKQRIPHNNIIKDWSCLSWAAKWLYDNDMLSDILTPEEAVAHDDKRIIESIWGLFDIADIVIAHNAKRFDLRKLNIRFLINGLRPPTPYQVIDTLKESQKVLGASSHRLDYLGKILSNKGKIDTNYDLWVRCDSGDKEALEYMQKYNEEDVLLLEEIYLWLRPWIHSHPNMAIYSFSEETICPYCGSSDLDEAGYYVTPAGRFISMRCNECGGVSRRRKTDLSKKEKENLIVSTAR